MLYAQVPCSRAPEDANHLEWYSSEDADLMLEDELRALSTEKKEQLLHDAEITVNILPMQGLSKLPTGCITGG